MPRTEICVSWEPMMAETRKAASGLEGSHVFLPDFRFPRRLLNGEKDQIKQQNSIRINKSINNQMRTTMVR